MTGNQAGIDSFTQNLENWLKIWPTPPAWNQQSPLLYRQALAHLSPTMLNEAFRRCLQTSRYLPMPADLLEAVKDDRQRQAASRVEADETPYSAAAKAWIKAGYPSGLKPSRKHDGVPDDDAEELGRKRAECERISLDRDAPPARASAEDRAEVAGIVLDLRRAMTPTAKAARSP